MFLFVKHKLKIILTFSILFLLPGCGGNNEDIQVATPSPGEGALLYKIDVELSVSEPARYWCDSIQFLGGLIYMNVRTDDNLESCSGAMEYVGTYTLGEDDEYVLSFEDNDIELSLFFKTSDRRTLDTELTYRWWFRNLGIL